MAHLVDQLKFLNSLTLNDDVPVEYLPTPVAEYAKGRKLEASDLKPVEVLTEQAAKNDFRLNDMISELATGDLMRMR
jgi:hypothetical protein